MCLHDFLIRRLAKFRVHFFYAIKIVYYVLRKGERILLFGFTFLCFVGNGLQLNFVDIFLNWLMLAGGVKGRIESCMSRRVASRH